MKNKLNIMTFTVASLLYGLCVTAQATDTTITFNGTAGEGAFDQINVAEVYSEGGYVMSNSNTSAFFADDGWGAVSEGAEFDDDYVIFFANPGASVTFTAAGGLPFSAKSLEISSHTQNSQMTLTGHRVGGTTVSIILAAGKGQLTTNYLSGFTNLTSLVILPSGAAGGATAGDPMIDNLVLTTELAPAPAPLAVIDFTGRALSYAPWAIKLAAPGGMYVEDGYAISNENTSAFFVSSNWHSQTAEFDGDSVVFFNNSAPLVFSRVDAQPFSATRLVIGSYSTTAVNGRFLLTGNISGGGTVSAYLYVADGEHETNFLSIFNNLTSLEILPITGTLGAPIFDDLVLTTDVDPAPAPSVVIDFNGVVAVSNSNPFAVGGFEYTEDGYAMTVHAAGVALVDNAWNGSADVAPFEDDFLWVGATGGKTVTFTPESGQPFNATSLIMGAWNGGSQISLTGNRVGGGTVTMDLAATQGAHTNVILSGFSKLTSLDIYSDAGYPLLDDLIFEVYVPSSTVTLIMIK